MIGVVSFFGAGTTGFAETGTTGSYPGWDRPARREESAVDAREMRSRPFEVRSCRFGAAVFGTKERGEKARKVGTRGETTAQ